MINHEADKPAKRIDFSSRGENFLIESGYSMILYRQLFEDERWRMIEGDFRLQDGSRLIEVKTDTLCLAQNGTNRIPIEIYHPRHKDGNGWYENCHINGVTDVLFFCTHGKGGDLKCVIDISFAALRKFVEAKRNDEGYMKQFYKFTCDGVGNLCIPLDDLHHIPGTRWLYSLELKGEAQS